MGRSRETPEYTAIYERAGCGNERGEEGRQGEIRRFIGEGRRSVVEGYRTVSRFIRPKGSNGGRSVGHKQKDEYDGDYPDDSEALHVPVVTWSLLTTLHMESDTT